MTNRAKIILLIILVFFALVVPAYGEPIPFPNVDLNIQQADQPQEVMDSVKLLVILTLLSLAPGFLIMMTCFTRIVIVLSFVRSALGTQQIPPNQIIIGLALILTVFIMNPVLQQVNDQAVKPYLAEQISQEEAVEAGSLPIKKFMLKETREKDLALFLSIAKEERPQNQDAVPFRVVLPAFVISELKTAFQMGFLLFVPFLIIDMVVASILMSMGMFMLPPVMISLPFKILLFVMVDGWYLVVKSLVESF
ncbi:flagellar type III secretion system pore protein FliP [Candidatus Formimonas warabiya]|nr:flagellar type III secretion system pore protein FliP [Candidatus Formimonas warabiya]